jgi:hypothetical protein
MLLLLLNISLLNYPHWLANLFAYDSLPVDLFFDHSRSSLLMNNCRTLSLFMNELLMRFVNHRLMHLMDYILVALMDDRLVNLTHFFLIDNRLMMLMNDWLMVLMNDVLVVLVDNISVMLMNDISMRFLNNCCICLCNNSWRDSMRFNYSLLDISCYHNGLLMANDCGCQISILNYRSGGCLN